MTITRQAFLNATLGSSVLLLLTACGGGGSDDDTPTVACGAAGDQQITGNHGHVLVIPRADLDSTTTRTYNIKGASTHPHEVSLTSAQFAELKAGRSVVLTSTTDANHSHQVTASCA